MKKFTIKLLALSLIVSVLINNQYVFAESNTYVSSVALSQPATILSVTLPTSLPIEVDSNNNVTVSSSLKIINNSYGPILVSGAILNVENGWNLVSINTNFKNTKVGIKQLGVNLQGKIVNTTGNCDTSNFSVINGGEELEISYDAKTAVQIIPINENIGSIIFTISWATISEYGLVPANVTDYYTFTDDTAATGGLRVRLTTAFKSALGNNTSYKDWMPGNPLPNPGSTYNGTPVTSMFSLFSTCNSDSLNLSEFDTSNVKNMAYMFYNCIYLKNITLTNFNTQNVLNMGLMFNGCNSLLSVDLSSFDNSNCSSHIKMFSSCSSLVTLDLSTFNMNKDTAPSNMLEGCTKITTAYARTESDATILNNSSGKPSTFTFVVK